MASNNPAILLTGRPGVGKSTAISKIVSLLGDRAAGFYTREIRAGGQSKILGTKCIGRTGFEIVTLDGRVGYLATRDPDIAFAWAASFGRYRVNLEAIDALAVPAIRQAMKRGQVVVID
jgi:nucleoside-triphosphatase